MTEPRDDANALGACLVTGGGGYLGRHLALELARRGCRVRVFDQAPVEFGDARIDVVRGDIRDYAALRKACEGIETVFHTVAILDFHRFPDRKRRAFSEGINVRGVENVVRACREAGVARLVHTSTNNVTFDGPVLDGDESWPYARNAKDLYTHTKIRGEELALAANGQDGLLSCAIRPGGIYGPGEGRILPRFAENLVAGRFTVRIGDGSAKSDNSYIDNLVDGQVEAALHLRPGSPVSGQAYFVTDGEPINYFEFFRPFTKALGRPFPTRHIPARPIVAFLWLWEAAGRVIPLPEPPFLALELRKLAIPHYSSIDKARRDFGWVPKVSAAEGARRCIPWVRELCERVERVDRPPWAWWLAIPFGMGLLAVLAFSADAHALWEARVTTWTPQPLLMSIFVWAALLHVYKGMKAVRIAEQAGLHATSMGWGWQTFLLGFPSLGLLEKRVAERQQAQD